jgi:hypothetical protein
MYKNATKCNETIGKWCKTKHGASKIIDTFETYQRPPKHHQQQKAANVARTINKLLRPKRSNSVARGGGVGSRMASVHCDDYDSSMDDATTSTAATMPSLIKL